MGKALGLLIATGTLVVGCAHAPKTASERSELKAEAQQTIADMTAKDPDLQSLMNQAAGYVVFPKVGSGGLVVGGAGGRGVIYEHGIPTGYAELSGVSFGAEAGGKEYSQLIVFRDRDTLQRLKAGKFDFGAEASAVAVKSGAASQTQFGEKGVVAFISSEKGAMFNLSLTGQRIKIIG
jgi:lipid-binding SYLF domain-containing protein